MHLGRLKRRDFITLLGGAAACPQIVRAQQQSSLPIIGFLNSGSRTTPGVDGFREALRDGGYIEGTNVAIEYRFAEGRYELLPALVSELTQRPLALLAATGGVHTLLAAKHATALVPMIFVIGADPVQFGLVQSFNRPGGNVTGVTISGVELTAKRLDLLRELTPQATRFVALVNPGSVMADGIVKNVEASAPIFGLPVEILHASTDRELVAAFSGLSQRADAVLLVTVDGFFFNRRALIVTLAARHALPTVYYSREYAEVGGLISYGSNVENVLELTGIYTGRILKGEKPADLPVAQPTKFELVVNLVTAKALGFDIPPTLLALADEVIE